jgi:tRNA pseudouridine55 synthase
MDGALIIDKPVGITSHDVVARVRKIVGERRVGHTGTLDPFATGILVLLIGRATRLAQFLSGAEKEYEALIRLGYSTDTGDVTGKPVETEAHPKAQRAQRLRKENIEISMASLRGEIHQVPPMYSAKKVGGRKLYDYARRGEQLKRQPICVTIHEFELVTRDGACLQTNEDGSIDVRARVVCSAGTYIRTLAEDLGKTLGLGAHLVELRRLRAGLFSVEEAITLEELAELAASESLARVLISPNDALSHLPSIELPEDQARRTLKGIDLRIDLDEAAWNDGDSVRMTSRGELIAVGRFGAAVGVLHPAVVLGSN